MHATTKTTSGMAAALALLVTLSVPVKAETDIVANGALNFFFPHGAVSLAIGQPIYRHYGNTDYHYEKRHYVPKYSGKSHHYQNYNRHYRDAPVRYVVIEKPNRHRSYDDRHPSTHHDNYSRHGYKGDGHHHGKSKDYSSKDYRNHDRRFRL